LIMTKNKNEPTKWWHPGPNKISIPGLKKAKSTLDIPHQVDYSVGTVNDETKDNLVMQPQTSFIQSGNIFRFNDKSANQVHDELPASNYIIQQDQFGNLFLERVASFPQVKKVYGNVLKNTDRILNTFRQRPSGTGVVLNGEKGSGKTLLAKTVVREAAERYGYPTLLINQPLFGDRFNKFIQSINQPAILLFDEFEKVYDPAQQEQMLTLLDGAFPSKKLFIITCNDKWRMNEHMRNRPGRIYYMIDFDGLEADFIREYCEDTLEKKEHINQIVTLSGFYTKFNFDMLQALVEEINRYDETPEQALTLLNAKVEYSGDQTYTIKVFVDGQPVKLGSREDFRGNPISSKFDIYWENGKKDSDGDELWDEGKFGPADLVAIDPVLGTVTYAQGKTTVVLTRKRAYTYDVFKSGVF